ncbi:MAG TPA: PKD domain-containing protein [Thermoanaerobaculia bacterium]|nr:PKD domain-containing protein [Thermoanaerobaculia bacterium]
MNRFRVYGVTCVLMLAAAATRATTIVMPSDEQLIAKTPVILIGSVTATRPVERDGKIWTESSVDVARVLKGQADASIVVREIGGEIDGRFTKLFGTAELAKGERVLLFLEPSPSGGYRTIDLFAGKFGEGKTLDGRRMWLRDDLAAEVVLLDQNFQPLHAKNVQRDAAAFETFVGERIAGRVGARNYGVENPVLARDVAGSAPGSVQSNFTMLSEPTIYRWGSFDSGVTASWYHAGTQSGYTGGGVNELKTAMAAWTGYGAARILYSYSGAHTGAIGGHATRNNVNEVVFGDPNNEISGTFTGSGVVGTGGFNGVSGSANWNAPFTADATHTAGAKSVYNISEGNLVIQDGVSPSTGISPTRLAEIIAHEFGHTLGFGHSTDSSALMYSSVTGLGPSLRSDDQTAARWLYPSGSAPAPTPTPTVPAAPSNLSGTPSGTNLQLHWSDNANNETGQSIYLAAGTGSYSRVADVGANTTSATLSGFAAGSYRVYVSAFNSAGHSPASNTIAVSFAGSTPLKASFSWSPSNPTTNDTVSFADQTTGGVSSWSWSLGDGTYSSAQNPSKRYATPGTYSVTLTAFRNSESSTSVRQVVVSAPSPITPAVTYRSLISAAAQTNGLGGTSWRTELSLFNAGTQGASVTLLFIPGADGSMITRSIFLAPRQSATYANALLDLFGLGTGAGALAIEATSAGADADLRVTSRTFTSGGAGTYGQSVPGVQDGALEQTLYLTGIQSSAAYRTNIGLVNRGGAAATASLTLYDANGSTISTANIALPANNFQQSSLQSYFPEVKGKSYDSLSMRVSAASQNAVTAYASIIDNASQDPVYVQAMPARGGNSLTLPAVGRASGANGTFWRSDVTLFNPTGNWMFYTFRYAGTTKTLSLGARETFTLRDVVTEMGHGNGSGIFTISWNGGGTPIVMSRTYTTNGNGGTFGQSIDPIETFATEMYVPGLRSDTGYRSNVGFVNGGSEHEQLQVTLLAPGGYALGSAVVGLAPGAMVQHSVTSLFPNVSASAGSFTLHVRGDGNAKLFAFGSMIDNASGDPVFFAGR